MKVSTIKPDRIQTTINPDNLSLCAVPSLDPSKQLDVLGEYWRLRRTPRAQELKTRIHVDPSCVSRIAAQPSGAPPRSPEEFQSITRWPLAEMLRARPVAQCSAGQLREPCAPQSRWFGRQPCRPSCHRGRWPPAAGRLRRMKRPTARPCAADQNLRLPARSCFAL